MSTTKAEQIRQRIDALVEHGTKKAEAFRQLATEFDQPVDSIRGSYYSAKRAAEGRTTPTGTRRRGKKATTTEDAVEAAVNAMRQSIEAVEHELELAKTKAEDAQAHYDGLQESARERIAAIEAKIAALGDSDDDKEASA
ncbi:MAG: hypothetical protein JHC84_05410 [Solirubrobacteraceae bacterium]|nr:hypothetical protein [Solirubrobacteraceae bacterium]